MPKRLRRDLRAGLRAARLSGGATRVAEWLAKHLRAERRPVSVREIMAGAKVYTESCVRALDRLEAGGFIVRDTSTRPHTIGFADKWTEGER